MGEDPTGRKRARAAIEAVALALLAALPLLPYFLYLRGHHVERFSFVGDFAGLELATRYVPSGRTLLGPYSRFGFSHPGPLYFYALAPTYAAWGKTSTGIMAGAAAINTAAVFAIVGSVRLATTRAYAVAVALVVVAWLGAFGDVCANPWNPLVVVLPLVAYLVLVALVTNGAWRAMPFAVLAGTFAAETHLSTIPAVLGVGVTACAVLALRVRRGGLSFGRHERRWALGSVVVLLLTVAPPLAEELVTKQGNIGKLVHFFAARTEPMRPISAAFTDWTTATSWLPDRLISGSVAEELYPEVMRSGPPWNRITTTSMRATLAVVLLSAGAAALARRRRDSVSLAFLGFGLLTSALSVVALRAIVGVNYIYLLFWTTAGTTLLWVGVVSTVAKALADLAERAPRPVLARLGAALALAATLFAAVRVSSLQRAFLARETLRPVLDVTEHQAYDALRAHLAETGETPVLHAYGAWHYGLSFLLEASKDGLDARVVERDRWIFGRQPAGVDGVTRPLHVFVHTPDAKVFTKDCMQKFATVGTIELYGSPVDVEVCDAPKPKD